MVSASHVRSSFCHVSTLTSGLEEPTPLVELESANANATNFSGDQLGAIPQIQKSVWNIATTSTNRATVVFVAGSSPARSTPSIRRARTPPDVPDVESTDVEAPAPDPPASTPLSCCVK